MRLHNGKNLLIPDELYGQTQNLEAKTERLEAKTDELQQQLDRYRERFGELPD